MFKKILLVLAALVVIFIIVVAMQPGEFRVTRTTTIHAAPGAVFAQVNDFHKWEKWSPWAKLDPNAKNSFEGPQNGVGSIFRWSGNKEVGVGSMTIVESHPDESILIKLEFLEPFAATNTSEFTFKPEGTETTVTWSMYGKNNFISKAMSLFMNCDEMIGGMFEKGLDNLKTLIESYRGGPPL